MGSTVGSHIENGLFAVYGARLGTYLTNCTDWDHVQVRDFELLRELYNEQCIKYEDGSGLEQEVQRLGSELKHQLGFNYPDLDPSMSKYVLDLYEETIELGQTYYRTANDL